jgi:hypothetical protein
MMPNSHEPKNEFDQPDQGTTIQCDESLDEWDEEKSATDKTKSFSKKGHKALHRTSSTRQGGDADATRKNKV